MDNSKTINAAWVKSAPTQLKKQPSLHKAKVYQECGCLTEIRGNTLKVVKKAKKCSLTYHRQPLDAKPPKKKPVLFKLSGPESLKELLKPKEYADINGTVFCFSCDNDFYKDVHTKGKFHRKTGYGHYCGYELWMTDEQFDKQLEDYRNKYDDWFNQQEEAYEVKTNFKKGEPNLDAKPENVVWTGVLKDSEDNKLKVHAFTARTLLEFSIRRTVKRTKDRDWDLYKKQTEGVDILQDIATNAVVKFLRVNTKGTIRNPYTYLSRCIDTAITDYRKERIKQRLSIVSTDVFDYFQGNDGDIDYTNDDEFIPLDSHLNAEPAVYLDYYQAIKTNPLVANQVHTLQQLFKSKGISLPPSHVRAVANALSGKNKGLHGNKTTKRYISNVLKQLKDSTDDTINVLYQQMTGKSLPRPELKVVKALKGTLDEDLEPEMPVTRWKTVNGERVYL
jgi:hypothetical protein